MAEKMNKDEWRRFVSEGTRTAKLSTVRADGSPHVAPVWFVLDGTDVLFTTGEDTVKGRNILRDGRVAICVDDEHPPFSFAVLQGTAEVSRDMAELLRWATLIGGRYMGEESAEQFGARNAVPEELLVRVRVDKVVALAGVAD